MKEREREREILNEFLSIYLGGNSHDEEKLAIDDEINGSRTKEQNMEPFSKNHHFGSYQPYWMDINFIAIMLYISYLKYI